MSECKILETTDKKMVSKIYWPRL